MKTMRVTAVVTQKDLDEGTACMPRICPLAKALRRVLKIDPLKGYDLMVGSGSTRYFRGAKLFVATHTPKVETFIMKVDEGAEEKPNQRFTFTFKRDRS